MTTNLNVMEAGSADVTYRIEHRGGCVLVFGAVPMMAFEHVAALAPEGSVLHSRLNRMSGSTFAMGRKEDAERLCVELAPAAIASARSRYAGSGLSDAAIMWLATGELGLSSMAMFRRMTGVTPSPMKPESLAAHPHDPDDLSRCRLLLEQVPDLEDRLALMSDVSPVWAAIVQGWTDLCAVMDAECADWREGMGSAPATYERLQAFAGMER